VLPPAAAEFPDDSKGEQGGARNRETGKMRPLAALCWSADHLAGQGEEGGARVVELLKALARRRAAARLPKCVCLGGMQPRTARPCRRAVSGAADLSTHFSSKSFQMPTFGEGVASLHSGEITPLGDESLTKGRGNERGPWRGKAGFDHVDGCAAATEMNTDAYDLSGYGGVERQVCSTWGRGSRRWLALVV